MAKTSTVTFSIGIIGDGVNNSYSPPGSPVSNNTCPNSGPNNQPLSTGDNTIAVPAGASGAVISYPSGNTVQVKLKGAGGDTGVLLHLTNPGYIPLSPSQTSFILNAAAPVTVGIDFT